MFGLFANHTRLHSHSLSDQAIVKSQSARSLHSCDKEERLGASSRERIRQSPSGKRNAYLCSPSSSKSLNKTAQLDHHCDSFHQRTFPQFTSTIRYSNVYASDALPYMRGTRIPRFLGVRNQLNNYFAMYTRMTLPYTRETRLHRLLGVRNYLNNYFAIYTRLTRSHIHADVESLANLGLRII